MDRKTFIKKTAGAVLITIPVASVIRCSNSDDGSEDPGFMETPKSICIENGADGLVESNHGHTLIISKEDIAAAKRKTYTIQGAADHNHTIIVTSADFTAMKNNTRAVDIYSTTDEGHRHSVIVRCQV